MKPLLIFLMMSPVLGQGDALFPMPDILKDNVNFWIRIFTEISEEEWLLHDRDYPAVVFGKVRIGKGGSGRSEALKAFKKPVAAALGRMDSLPDSTLSPGDRRFLALYDSCAGKEAIKGAYRRLRFQKGLKEKFFLGLERSTQYLDTIRAVLKKEGVPLRLAYLPHVESSFNIHAGSRAGAMGMWQFMRATGKRYLRIDYHIDERRDPIRSTVAAARLLKKNFEVLKSWPLAVTAYNHGLNGMKRAVAATGTNDIAVILKSYESRSFKFASKNFYSSFLAASAVAAAPERWFPPIKPREKYRVRSFVLPYHLRPLALCDALGIEEAEFKRLNPAFRPVVFASQRLMPAGYAVNLPGTLAPQRALLALAVLPDSVKAQEPEASRYYTVVRGDNLYKISRRLGVRVKELIAANNIDSRHRIYPGQALTIPAKDVRVARGRSKAGRRGASHTSQPEVVSLAAAEIRDGAAAAKAVPPAPRVNNISLPDKQPKSGEPEAIPDYLTRAPTQKDTALFPEPSGHGDTAAAEILSGGVDTLEEIAAVVAVPESVSAMNGRPAISSRFNAAVYHLEIDWDEKAPSARIKAAVDETLDHYAEWLDVSNRRVRRFNRFKALKKIRIGQIIYIPMRSESAREKFAAARLEYHMSIEEDFYQQYRVEDFKLKYVWTFDDLWEIHESEGVPLWLLNKYNPEVDFSNLQTSEPLWIPIVNERSENTQTLKTY